MSLFSTISSALAAIKGEESKLKNELEKCLQRREYLKESKLPRDDFADKVCENLGTLGEKYPKDLRLHTLANFANNPMRDPGNIVGGLNVLCHAGNRQMINPSALAFIFRDQIEAGVRRAISEWDWPADSECGPPRHEREREMSKLNKKIADLQTKLDQLRAEAKSAGVSIG